MENEINLSKQQINSLLSSLMSDEKANDETEKIKNSLTPEQKQKLEGIMSDPEKIKAILTTPQAKRLLDMLRSKRE